MKFKYTVDPTAPEPIMLINGEIGTDVIGADFQTELLRLDTMGKTNMKVYINSPGGSVSDGMMIYNAIIKSKTKVDTYCVGMAASIAAIIFQAGRFRYMADYSILMFHAPYYPGTTKTDPYLDAMKDACKVMVERSGVSKIEVEKLLNNGDTFLTALEGLKEAGLCDYIELSADYNVKHGNSAIKASCTQGKVTANKYVTGTFRGQANALNIMASIAAKNNQR